MSLLSADHQHINNSGKIVDAPIVGIRYLQTMLMFLGMTTAYSMRVNMSVAIVVMVDNSGANTDFEDFPDWDEQTCGVILSSFFWGYVITQIPAGQLAQKYGPKVLLVFSLFVCSLSTLLTPIAASTGGWVAVCVCRVVQGLAQGFIIPSTHSLLSKWAPPAERGRLATYVYAGSQVGTVLALPIGGFLASSPWGWPSIFYCMGGIGILWSVLWFFLGADSPTRHPSISLAEKKYITESLGHTEDSEKRKLVTPWRYILTSLPMWSLVVAHCGQNFGFWMLLAEMPTYMNSVLHFNIKNNAMLSALPYFVMWILSFFFSSLSTYINNKAWITLGMSRKIFNTIGHWVPGAALICLAYVTSEQHVMAVALLVVAVGMNSAIYVGFQVNHIDLSPNFAGTMMGITNCISNVMSIMAPLAVGLLLTDIHSVEQWRIIFFLAAAIYFCCNLFYIIFGSGDLQPWNDLRTHNDNEMQPLKSVNLKIHIFKKTDDTTHSDEKL